jgi:glycerol-3-phosphate dehydrogenase (NAD(P)+)
VAAVIGAGSFGTALAGLLASDGTSVKLYARNSNVVGYMLKERHNPKYLPDFELPESVEPTSSLKEALDGEDLVVHAVPSKATRQTAREYAPHLDDGAIIVSATKGLERSTHKRMSEVIVEETGHGTAAISGPNHAEEVAKGHPTAAVVAFPDMDVATRIASAFETWHFKAYPRRDLIGVEICGAYKNVVALAGGMASGLGWGDNCLAALVTLGVDEMTSLTRFFGGDERTVTGLAGVGDLVATATSTHSRNRFYGEQLARGGTAKSIEKKMHGMVAEGVFASLAFHEYSKAEHMTLPLTHVVYQVCHENLPVQDAVEMLLIMV